MTDLANAAVDRDEAIRAGLVVIAGMDGNVAHLRRYRRTIDATWAVLQNLVDFAHPLTLAYNSVRRPFKSRARPARPRLCDHPFLTLS